jgi:hypothetical protein
LYLGISLEDRAEIIWFIVQPVVTYRTFSAAEVNMMSRIQRISVAISNHVFLLVEALISVSKSDLVENSAISQKAMLNSFHIHQHILDVLIGDILVILGFKIIIIFFESFWGRADFGISASVHASSTTNA